MAKFKYNAVIFRYRAIGILFILLLLWIFLSLSHTIFVDGPKWREIAETLHLPVEETVPPMRGNIISSDGHIIAMSKPIYRLYMDFRAEGIQNMDRDTLYKQLDSAAMHMSRWNKGARATYPELRKRLRNGVKSGSRYALMIPYDVGYGELERLRRAYPFTLTTTTKRGEKKQRGPLARCIIAEERAMRDKPYGQLASRTIGDVYKEVENNLSRGMYGLEQGCDSLLRGMPGRAVRQYVGGRTIVNTIDPPTDGYNVYTTIDMNYQQIVDRALRDQLLEFQADLGGAVVMEVATGRIVAISNLTASGDTYVEGTNYALSALNEPGSTFKTPFLMAALDDGIVRASDTIDVGNGVFPFGGYTIRDHNAHRGGYGRISVAQGLWYSSNIVMAKIAIEGYQEHPEQLYDHFRNYGLMDQLDMEIMGVGVPSFLTPDEKGFGTSTVAAVSRGYSVQLPAINTLNYYNGIANGGRIMKPYLVDRIEDASGRQIAVHAPKVLHDNICRPGTLDTIRQMLRDVVDQGTGRTVRSQIVPISGKTGTALMANAGSKGYRQGGVTYMASFCGYFPSDAPKYSCIVFIINPKGSSSGGYVGGRVVKRIAEEIYTQTHPMLLDTITPIPAEEDLSRLEIAGGRYETIRRFVRDNRIPLAPVPSGDGKEKIADDRVVTVRSTAEGVRISPLARYSRDIMPVLVGVAPDEAVYRAALLGLRVRLVGRGRVSAQSIPAGSKISSGQTVVLHLGKSS